MEIESSSQQSLHLPEEIIGEILPRLPVKSLLRFRCVSKSWGSLIGSERLIKKHHQNSMKNPSFLQQRFIVETDSVEWPQQCSLLSVLSGPINTIPFSPLAYPTNNTLPMGYHFAYPRNTTLSIGYEIVGSCNGLLCIVDDENIFHLWNPSTRIISKKLPEISLVNYLDDFDNFGFGWVESSDEYKVFVNVVKSDSSVGEIYSTRTKSWKTIDLCPYFLPFRKGGVFAGGKLYWMYEDDKVIIFLDLKSEEFGRIEIPFDQEMYGEFEQDNYGIVGVLGGFVCVLCFNYQIRGYRVWVTKESWEKVLTLSHLLELLQPPLVKGLNGDILVNCGSTVVVYDCQDNVFRDLKYCSCCEDSEFNSHEDCVDSISHDVYVESLVSPEDF
ncbi:F-box/kelch-repeat protein At3g06240-like [Salvia miltiorrhiza]|uniref:F-box/kelch-repeat protein At3g06240-like n=2 Tax=Salvia miltiorrhiza TaxID=226208 RepID=UPI0025ABF6D7|nr:F-box/kelch-repeat protein At3g06240-like [Salvia miltiorrhiza]